LKITAAPAPILRLSEAAAQLGQTVCGSALIDSKASNSCLHASHT
jgi:hypothetical protein